MGLCLAQAALLRGAEVELVHGPLVAPEALREGLHCHPISTAAELEAALTRLQPSASAIAMAAAVADYRRTAPRAEKLPKQELEEALSAGWEPVPDLLAGLVARRPPGQAILGFAAYSGVALEPVRAKFARKGCDLLFANPIDQPGAGFGSPTNAGWLFAPGGIETRLESATKLAIAHQLLTALGAVRPGAGVAPAGRCLGEPAAGPDP
jgi:phosphopantothenoylcysteine decarboxylase/phosphopantothenate--cysteine ligase